MNTPSTLQNNKASRWFLVFSFQKITKPRHEAWQHLWEIHHWVDVVWDWDQYPVLMDMFRCVSISISAKFTDRQTHKQTLSFVCLCMTLFAFVCLCMTIYDYVWLCMTIYYCVWLCMVQYYSVWLPITMPLYPSIFLCLWL